MHDTTIARFVRNFPNMAVESHTLSSATVSFDCVDAEKLLDKLSDLAEITVESHAIKTVRIVTRTVTTVRHVGL